MRRAASRTVAGLPRSTSINPAPVEDKRGLLPARLVSPARPHSRSSDCSAPLTHYSARSPGPICTPHPSPDMPCLPHPAPVQAAERTIELPVPHSLGSCFYPRPRFMGSEKHDCVTERGARRAVSRASRTRTRFLARRRVGCTGSRRPSGFHARSSRCCWATVHRCSYLHGRGRRAILRFLLYSWHPHRGRASHSRKGD